MLRDFVAIDFETANEQPCSVCSVGIVIVKDGEVADSFYSLIHPEPDYYQYLGSPQSPNASHHSSCGDAWG